MGSEFTVRLPIANAQAAQTRLAPVAERVRYAGSLRILLAENDADAGESLQALFNQNGYEAHLAKDGPAALAVAFDLQPQVVLLDIGLPGMSGFELAQRLRERMHNPGLRSVALSGYGQPEDLRRSREAGINYHLVKPLRFDKLQEILGICEVRGR
jgi:CheY-like chemotaxis protein